MSGHTGTMIALYLPDEIAQKVAIPDGESASSMHVTLAYLGKELTDKQKKQVRKVVKKLAVSTGAIEATLGGVGRFSASATSEGRDVVYLSVDSPGVTALHPKLLTALATVGVEPSKIHGFTPHVTLAYVPIADRSPIDRFEPVALTFGALSLTIAEDREDFPFGMSAAEHRAAEVAADLKEVFSIGENFPFTGYGISTPAAPKMEPVVSFPFHTAVAALIWSTSKKILSKNKNAPPHEILRLALDASKAAPNEITPEDVRLLELAISWAQSGPAPSGE